MKSICSFCAASAHDLLMGQKAFAIHNPVLIFFLLTIYAPAPLYQFVFVIYQLVVFFSSLDHLHMPI